MDLFEERKRRDHEASDVLLNLDALSLHFFLALATTMERHTVDVWDAWLKDSKGNGFCLRDLCLALGLFAFVTLYFTRNRTSGASESF